MPTIHHIYASGPFTLVLIRTNFAKYVSVIFVLQVESHRTHLPLKCRNITKLFQNINKSRLKENNYGNLWHAWEPVCFKDLRTKSC